MCSPRLFPEPSARIADVVARPRADPQLVSVSPTYPREQEADVVLRDGSTVHVRPVRAGDEPQIRAFLDGLSRESIGFRFFGAPNLDWVTAWSVDVDYADRYALVAISGAAPAIIAHGAYVRTGKDRAEIAFVVADAWQGQGIATILLAHLASIAERHGIATFTGEVLPHNHRMIEVLRESGFPVDMRSTPDAIAIELPTSLTPEGLERFEERGRIAAVAAVRGFLEPRSVAVIGASRRRGTIGAVILRNILSSDFAGVVYAVNAGADVVQSLPAYRSVTDIPVDVDLAVVVVPAEHVVDVAHDCAEKGVRSLLVISAGFQEAGEEGARRQRELVEVCRDAGIRIIGPNCLGVLNTDEKVGLNATFAPRPAVPGPVGFLSQSGGLGIAVIEAAGRLGVGLSSFVSVGNQSDLFDNDFLQYWEQDANTTVALLYLESFGNPREFARVAPRIAKRKPILAVKSGRSSAGAQATSSHTGALLSASDVTVDALFEQAGVIRADTLHELFDVAVLLSKQPVPRGDRVAIVTNAGGPGIMCADACQAYGAEVQELPERVTQRLAEFLPATASLRNPVDMIASATADDYGRAVDVLAESDVCDAIIVIFVPALATRAPDVAAAVDRAAAGSPAVAIASVFMTSDRPPPEVGRSGVPVFEFPEEAARAVALAARHGRWRARSPGTVPALPGYRQEPAAAVISQALAAGTGWLSPAQVAELLACFRLPLVPTRVVADIDGAARAAGEYGAPVALKAIATGLLHKSDAGGVVLGLDGPEAVRGAALEIEAAVQRAGHRLEGLIVQPMVPEGVELIVGVVNDHNFGQVLACGAGGTTAELIKDVAVRITPITDVEAHDMVRSLRTFPLLDGYRGAPRCDIAAIEEVLLRVSAMVDAHPEIAELDLNPLVASPEGAMVVDARVRVETAPVTAPVPSLRA
jgi:acetyl coenzyme A synthetase (ADP forming)-like protein